MWRKRKGEGERERESHVSIGSYASAGIIVDLPASSETRQTSTLRLGSNLASAGSDPEAFLSFAVPFLVPSTLWTPGDLPTERFCTVSTELRL